MIFLYTGKKRSFVFGILLSKKKKCQTVSMTMMLPTLGDGVEIVNHCPMNLLWTFFNNRI